MDSLERFRAITFGVRAYLMWKSGDEKGAANKLQNLSVGMTDLDISNVLKYFKEEL